MEGVDVVIEGIVRRRVGGYLSVTEKTKKGQRVNIKGDLKRRVKEEEKATEQIFKERQKKADERNATIDNLENKIKSAKKKLDKASSSKQIEELNDKISELENEIRVVEFFPSESVATINDLEKKLKSARKKLKNTREEGQINKLENKILGLHGKLQTIRNETFSEAGLRVSNTGFSPSKKDLMSPIILTKKDIKVARQMAGDPLYSSHVSFKEMQDFNALKAAKQFVLNLKQERIIKCKG